MYVPLCSSFLSVDVCIASTGYEIIFVHISNVNKSYYYTYKLFTFIIIIKYINLKCYFPGRMSIRIIRLNSIDYSILRMTLAASHLSLVYIAPEVKLIEN